MRGLFRAPGFTLITVGTLALGIGVVAAIFTVVNGVLLKPLPFEDPEELVAVWHARGGAGNVGLSTAMGLAYRAENRFFEDIGCWYNRQGAATGAGDRGRRLGRSDAARGRRRGSRSDAASRSGPALRA